MPSSNPFRDPILFPFSSLCLTKCAFSNPHAPISNLHDAFLKKLSFEYKVSHRSSTTPKMPPATPNPTPTTTLPAALVGLGDTFEITGAPEDVVSACACAAPEELAALSGAALVVIRKP